MSKNRKQMRFIQRTYISGTHPTSPLPCLLTCLSCCFVAWLGAQGQGFFHYKHPRTISAKIWWLPELGVPLNHPFKKGFPSYTPSYTIHFWVPPFMETLYIIIMCLMQQRCLRFTHQQTDSKGRKRCGHSTLDGKHSDLGNIDRKSRATKTKKPNKASKK